MVRSSWRRCLLSLTNCAFTLAGSVPVQNGLCDLLWALWLIQIGGTGSRWLFTLSLFEDHRLRLASFDPAIALVVIGLIALLGYRNFTASINHRRIAAARAILEDPAEARRIVASIAFDLGFGSLGPFNRSFREATGVSPDEYRTQAWTAAGPNSENPA